MKLLHVTAHLGGGVGKVLSRLVEASARQGDGIQHTIACLEAPERDQFVGHALAHGATLLICPTADELARRIAGADIVQLEWWHHPVVAGWLGRGPLPPMRLVVWSHVSGLHVPLPPTAFVTAPHRFLFTSPCGLDRPEFAALTAAQRQRLDAVFSSGGFDDLPPPPERPDDAPLRVGYFGTLNFAKLHPEILDYLAAVDLPGFKLILIGDPAHGQSLVAEAERRGLGGRLELRGYRTDVAAELAQLDVLAYLLNPLHYGTTENALLEAMAMGVVPIVLDNPAERHLVRHGETGLMVSSPADFATALRRLATLPAERRALATAASHEIRRRFDVAHTAARLRGHYQAVLAEAPRSIDLRPALGPTPSDWFLACQGSEARRFLPDGSVDLSGTPPHFLFEPSKGSARHFHRAFPDDPRLAGWARALEAAQP